MTQFQDIAYTVRLDGENPKQLSVTDINTLNDQLAAKGEAKLIKIKRSNGDTEYVTRNALKQLEADRARRSNQRKLAELRDNPGAKPKQANRFVRALKELLR